MVRRSKEQESKSKTDERQNENNNKNFPPTQTKQPGDSYNDIASNRLTIFARFHTQREVWAPAVFVLGINSKGVFGIGHELVYIEAREGGGWVLGLLLMDVQLVQPVLVQVPLVAFVLDLKNPQEHAVRYSALDRGSTNRRAAFGTRVFVAGRSRADSGARSQTGTRRRAAGSAA
jgi:hypothetical protein